MEVLSQGHARQVLNTKKELLDVQKNYDEFRAKIFGAETVEELDEGYDSDARMQDLQTENMELRVSDSSLNATPIHSCLSKFRDLLIASAPVVRKRSGEWQKRRGG